MTKKTLDYEISNVGGIDHVSLKLASGVNILRGHNAAGKTSAMRAISRTQGGKDPLERRDGTAKGTVRGPGVSLTIRKVVSTTGEAEMSLADTGPLARLIDPGHKSSDAAARDRVRALIELLDLGVEDEYLELLSQGDEGLHDWLRQEVNEDGSEDLMTMAELLRRQSHARARAEETDAENANGKSQAADQRCRELMEQLGGPSKLAAMSVTEAREQNDTLTRRHERLVAQCEAREELEKKQDAIKETLGVKPDAMEALADVADLENQHTKVRADMNELSKQLNHLTTERAAIDRFLLLAREKTIDKQAAVERWEKQSAILEQPLEGPTRDQVNDLKTRFVDEARRDLDAAQRSADYKAELERRALFQREADEADKLAEHYRELAANISAVLGEILASKGAPGLTVIEGRLHATEGNKDFEHRCSTGERVALALKVAATSYQGKVLPLDGALWASLDPENKAAFDDLAEELGLYVITEEPTSGSLRIETEK